MWMGINACQILSFFFFFKFNNNNKLIKKKKKKENRIHKDREKKEKKHELRFGSDHTRGPVSTKKHR